MFEKCLVCELRFSSPWWSFAALFKQFPIATHLASYSIRCLLTSNCKCYILEMRLKDREFLLWTLLFVLIQLQKNRKHSALIYSVDKAKALLSPSFERKEKWQTKPHVRKPKSIECAFGTLLKTVRTKRGVRITCDCEPITVHKSTQVFDMVELAPISFGHPLVSTLVKLKFLRKSTQVFHRLATQRRSTQIDRKSTVYAWNLRLFAICVNLQGDLRISLAAHRKSVRKFWFCKLASTCIALRLHLIRTL